MELGAKVVTASDSGGTVVDEVGFTPEKLAHLAEIKNKRYGTIEDYARERNLVYLAGQQPWSVPVDIALPCATQNELDLPAALQLIANGVKAVAEGANMPTTIQATDAFLEAGVLFAPGKAANAGGVATSGLEMAQNAARMSWKSEKLMSVYITSCWIFTSPVLNTAVKASKPTMYTALILPGLSKWPMQCWPKACCK